MSTKIPARDIDVFRKSCRIFYINLTEQIILRLAFQKVEINMIVKFAVLDNVRKFKTISDVSCILGVDHKEVNREYRLLRKSSYVTDLMDEDYSARITKF